MANNSPCIYKITSPSGSVYIGQTKNRIRRFRSYKQLKCLNQSKLYSSFIKYGYENHTIEIVHELPIDVPLDVLDRYEFLYWDLYKSCNKSMLNLKEPGKSGRFDKESREKMRQSALKSCKRGKDHYLYGKGIPKEQRALMTNKLSKKVMNILTKEIYSSVRKAARENNIDPGNLRNYFKGKYKKEIHLMLLSDYNKINN